MRVCIIIPAYEPDGEFPETMRTLGLNAELPAVVVDDGSGERYRGIFDEISALPHCTVLRHEKNRGKGVALKTAFSFFRDNLADFDGAVTADCDGQHAQRDILRVAEAVSENPRSLILGERDFSGGGIPLRSRFGNRFTAAAFALLFGGDVKDTQTGLRGIPAALMEDMLSIEGERFEYEMNMLAACREWGVPIVSVPITTIYEEKGRYSSHFNTFKDSARVFLSLIRVKGKYRRQRRERG